MVTPDIVSSMEIFIDVKVSKRFYVANTPKNNELRSRTRWIDFLFRIWMFSNHFYYFLLLLLASNQFLTLNILMV